MRLGNRAAQGATGAPPATLATPAVTLMGVLLASTLFCHELSWYLSPKAHSKMEVDLRRHRDLGINVDVTFHAVPCAGAEACARSGAARGERYWLGSCHCSKALPACPHTPSPQNCRCISWPRNLVPARRPQPMHHSPVPARTHKLTPAALSVDIIDASGTADSDVNYARGVHLRKVRLDAQGRPLQGAGDYRTPQSQRLVDAGGSTVVNVDLGEAMRHMGEMEQVRV